jgi:hypothetical protein
VFSSRKTRRPAPCARFFQGIEEMRQTLAAWEAKLLAVVEAQA